MTDNVYSKMPNLSDDEVNEYIVNHTRYTLEAVEVAADELHKRGKDVLEGELSAIKDAIQERDKKYRQSPENGFNFHTRHLWKSEIGLDAFKWCLLFLIGLSAFSGIVQIIKEDYFSHLFVSMICSLILVNDLFILSAIINKSALLRMWIKIRAYTAMVVCSRSILSYLVNIVNFDWLGGATTYQVPQKVFNDGIYYSHYYAALSNSINCIQHRYAYAFEKVY